MVGRRSKDTERKDRGDREVEEKDVSANSTRSTEGAPNDSPDPSQMLTSLIEAERTELMYVHSILRMLYDVLLYSDDDDAAMHADVARACSMLIRESMERLEVVARRYKAGEFRAPGGGQPPAEGA